MSKCKITPVVFRLWSAQHVSIKHLSLKEKCSSSLDWSLSGKTSFWRTSTCCLSLMSKFFVLVIYCSQLSVLKHLYSWSPLHQQDLHIKAKRLCSLNLNLNPLGLMPENFSGKGRASWEHFARHFEQISDYSLFNISWQANENHLLLCHSSWDHN